MLYETGTPENMNDALVECADAFGRYWGAKLLTALRMVHVSLFQQHYDDLRRSEQALGIDMEEASASGYDSEELSNL
jgi:hypothetical protein